MNDFCCLCVKIAISVTAKVCMCAVDSKMQDDSSEYVRCPLVDKMPLGVHSRRLGAGARVSISEVSANVCNAHAAILHRKHEFAKLIKTLKK